MNRCLGTLLAALALWAALLPSAAHADPPDPAKCAYGQNITVTQPEFATVQLGQTFQQVRAAVGGAGYPIDDDAFNWVRHWHACDGDPGAFVEMSFHRVPGQGLVLFHTSTKWR